MHSGDSDSTALLLCAGEGGGPSWKLKYTVCMPNITYNNSLTTSNYMLVNFLSDWGVNGTGFYAMVYSSKAEDSCCKKVNLFRLWCVGY